MSFSDLHTPPQIVPTNTRLVHPLGRDSAWITAEKAKRSEEEKEKRRREVSRKNMAKYRAESEASARNDALMAAVVGILREGDKFSYDIGKPLGLPAVKLSGTLAYMSRVGMITRDSESKPWRLP